MGKGGPCVNEMKKGAEGRAAQNVCFLEGDGSRRWWLARAIPCPAGFLVWRKTSYYYSPRVSDMVRP